MQIPRWGERRLRRRRISQRPPPHVMVYYSDSEKEERRGKEDRRRLYFYSERFGSFDASNEDACTFIMQVDPPRVKLNKFLPLKKYK